jgi:hypothetical protein
MADDCPVCKTAITNTPTGQFGGFARPFADRPIISARIRSPGGRDDDGRIDGCRMCYDTEPLPIDYEPSPHIGAMLANHLVGIALPPFALVPQHAV